MTCLPFVAFVHLVAKSFIDSFLAQNRSDLENQTVMLWLML